LGFKQDARGGSGEFYRNFFFLVTLWARTYGFFGDKNRVDFAQDAQVRLIVEASVCLRNWPKRKNSGAGAGFLKTVEIFLMLPDY